MQPGLTGDLERWPEILKYFLENGTKPGAGPFYAKCGFKASSVTNTAHGPVSVMKRSLVF